MDYSSFDKKLKLPAGFSAPRKLVHADVVAHALTRADLAEDVRGINSSLDLITRTRGGGWPTEPVTDDFNFVDLVWHEQEFRESSSFAYVLRFPNGDYMGCAYLYPLGQRTPLTEQLLGYDVDASWWVTQAAYDRGLYIKVYQALRGWLAEHFGFWRPYYSNREIPGGGAAR